ncbi:hemerythrin domain-containing protein [Noviherbaspirillum massiliense]|uniref:hemerythrin domain-containing protein n=1 Tax=Noviherbaspirillum massiliense TaxID=1465823 RepID=UPI0002FFD886|nr:hemerythrin domain-containing protein [Noviherbaspirillum massiliense]
MAEKDMDAVDLLVRQHRTLEDLLKKAVKTDGEEARKALFAEAGDLLTVHIESEEKIFYPAVNTACTENDLLEELEEHLSLKRLLADLLELDPADKTFEAKLKVLREQAEHHHKEEEEHLFPEARKLLDGARRQEIGKEMLSLQTCMNRMGEPREVVANETSSAAPLQ